VLSLLAKEQWYVKLSKCTFAQKSYCLLGPCDKIKVLPLILLRWKLCCPSPFLLMWTS